MLHLATPPLSAARVYEAFTGKTFTNHLPGAPFDYDLRTRHAALLGGAGEYLCTEPECLTAVCDFLKNWN